MCELHDFLIPIMIEFSLKIEVFWDIIQYQLVNNY
jgi:hypothetical protein